MDSTNKKATLKCDSKCETIKAYLSAYCSEELDPATRKEVEEHLNLCESCRVDFEEYKRVIDVLSVNASKNVSAPRTISPRKRKRMLWLMTHPFFAFCISHHRMTALVVALTIITLIIATLLTIKVVVGKDKPIGKPVIISVEKPATELPELEPDQLIPIE